MRLIQSLRALGIRCWPRGRIHRVRTGRELRSMILGCDLCARNHRHRSVANGARLQIVWNCEGSRGGRCCRRRCINATYLRRRYLIDGRRACGTSYGVQASDDVRGKSARHACQAKSGREVRDRATGGCGQD
jgi:hypothetical protein